MNTLRVRDLAPQDMRVISEIHVANSGFPFPDLGDGLYFIKKAILCGGMPIGAAFVRASTESILILDLRRPLITRARALKKLVELMEIEIPKFGVDETHCFVLGLESARTVRFLKDLGFVDCTGTPLYRQLGG